MTALDALVAGVRAAFERVHRDAFLGDPAANPRLTVDVVDAAVVADTPVLVLVTPWTVNGLAFPADDDFPAALELAGRRYPVFRLELPQLPPFRSVVLPVQTATIRDMPRARNLARSWIPPLHEAIRAARPGGDAGEPALAARPGGDAGDRAHRYGPR